MKLPRSLRLFRVLVGIAPVLLTFCVGALIGYLAWRGAPTLGRSLFFGNTPV